MANSYSRLLLHCVWSTKNRENSIHREWEAELWAYIGGLARTKGIRPIQIGGIENHIHAFVEPPKTMSASAVLQVLKTPSSYWVNQSGRAMGKFHWQGGYAAFSVSASSAPNVVKYIKNQREHHRRKPFEEEYQELLRSHEVTFEKAYLLG